MHIEFQKQEKMAEFIRRETSQFSNQKVKKSAKKAGIRSKTILTKLRDQLLEKRLVTDMSHGLSSLAQHKFTPQRSFIGFDPRSKIRNRNLVTPNPVSEALCWDERIDTETDKFSIRKLRHNLAIESQRRKNFKNVKSTKASRGRFESIRERYANTPLWTQKS